jgi:predicted SAM-dependent methyltransferase
MSNTQPIIKKPLHELLGKERVVVELGCGPIKSVGSIGIDIVDLPNVDIVADVNAGMAFFPDSSVDEVHASHFLEHTANLELVMSEIARILKPDGKLYIVVPHFSNPHYYSDYTHRTPWGLYTVGYFCKRDWPYSRHVPTFYNQIDFVLISQRIVFYSRFRLIKWAKKGVQLLVNSTPFLQELYEEILAWTITADSLEIVIQPGKGGTQIKRDPAWFRKGMR